MGASSDKWKHFERLVTAIHKAADEGAEVQWNETIGGRQFDVTIRFRKGLYKYLTVIECKHYEKPVPVEKVEAFVTKSADARANHAVMASTSGFQEGAQEVARKHNMTLIHITDSSEIDLSIFRAEWAGTTDALHIETVELQFGDGEKKLLPKESNALMYYVNQIIIQCGDEQLILNELIQYHSPRFHRPQFDIYDEHIITCPTGTLVVAPDDGEVPLKPLRCVHVRTGMVKAKTLRGPVAFDPYLLVPDVRVRNVITGEEKTFSQHDLQLGVDTVFAEGEFYEQPQLAAYYYCERINDDVATLYLVESFQLGELFQVKFTVEVKYAHHYVPVSDKAIIARLQRRLARLKASEQPDQTSFDDNTPSDEWLRQLDRQFRGQNVDVRQRPLIALARFCRDFRLRLPFDSPPAKRIFEWFLKSTEKEPRGVAPLFMGAYYYQRRFWAVDIPVVYGHVRLTAPDSLRDLPVQLKLQLMSDNDELRRYVGFWADCLDYAYGFDDMDKDRAQPQSGILLLRSGDRELRTVASLLLAQLSAKAVQPIRQAIEFFSTAFLILKGHVPEPGAGAGPHNLDTLLHECSVFSSQLTEALSRFRDIHKRHTGEPLPDPALWESYAIAQFVGAFVVRSFTQRDTRSQLKIT